jgi:hypothetical protein
VGREFLNPRVSVRRSMNKPDKPFDRANRVFPPHRNMRPEGGTAAIIQTDSPRRVTAAQFPMHPSSFWKPLLLAGALATVMGTGCCTCPPPPLLRPVLAWSPMRHHPCYRPGGHDALFGHRGTCWARWPAEWIPCPEQSCDTLLVPQPDELIPAPISESPEGFQGPSDGEPLPPPAMGDFRGAYPAGGFSIPATPAVAGVTEQPGRLRPRESAFLR